MQSETTLKSQQQIGIHEQSKSLLLTWSTSLIAVRAKNMKNKIDQKANTVNEIC